MDSITILSIIALILSTVIHEVAHGYSALLLGDRTAELAGRLTLNPLKHLTLMGSVIVPILTSLAGIGFGWAKPVPYNPHNLRAGKWGEPIVALAGPLSNLLLAIVFATFLKFQPNNLFFGIIVIVNCSLLVLNLIPIPPLDGSKVLFALIPQRFYSIRQTMEANQLYLLIALMFFWGAFEPVVRFVLKAVLVVFA
jgi:Zn-dependent protease